MSCCRFARIPCLRVLLLSLALVAFLPAGTVGAVDAEFCADAEEVAFLGLLNDYRAQNGLGPLGFSQTLGAASEHHSIEMATNGYFDHTMLGGVTVGENLRNHGYTDSTYGENIAAGMADAATVFPAWQNSASHNQNMLGGAYEAIGIGRAYNAGSGYGWYWTTIFGGTLDTPAAICGQEPPATADDPAEADNALVVEEPADATVSETEALPDPPLLTDANASTNDTVNLRAGPSLETAILTEVPTGARLTVTGEIDGGFYPVTYAAQSGWVAAEFVTMDGTAAPETTPEAAAQTAPSPTGEPVTTAVALADLNLRARPASDEAVLQSIPAGAVVNLSGEASGGYLGVAYGGTTGWADAAYLAPTETAAPAPTAQPVPDPPTNSAAPAGAGTATTTALLNLRSGPSYDDTILMEIPSGATVTLTGETSGGFFGAIYNGTPGWVDAAYLA